MLDSGLSYPPPANTTLVVAPHPSVLKVPQVSLTTVVGLDNNDNIVWTGSVDERHLTSSDQRYENARKRLAETLLSGQNLWRVIRPGQLRKIKQADTIYQGDRPWVVLGGPLDYGLLAAPLNDLGDGKLRPYQCAVDAAALIFDDSKDSKIELNHVWTFPPDVRDIGHIDSSQREAIERAVRREFPV